MAVNDPEEQDCLRWESQTAWKVTVLAMVTEES